MYFPEALDSVYKQELLLDASAPAAAEPGLWAISLPSVPSGPAGLCEDSSTSRLLEPPQRFE